MDKVRVYELARELGITSPETIQLLKSKLNIRVKSASSTVEEDTAIKLKRLIRLEGAGALPKKEKREKEKKPKAVAPSEGTEDRAQAARKRRAEKARQALLAEMEEEELAKERAKEEKERKAREAQEEKERREAEEAAKRAAAEAAAEAERLEKERAEREEREEEERRAREKEAEEAAASLEAREAPAEPSAPVAEQKPPEEAPPAVVSEEAPATEPKAAAAEETQPAPEPRRPEPRRREAPAEEKPAAAAAGPTPSTQKTPKPFVPGPTSQYVRTRPRPRREEPKPVSAPPRPAAPIKTVRARSEGKPKSKRRQKRAAAPVAADVMEQAIPEPSPGVEEKRTEAPKIYRKVSLTEGVTVKELAEKLDVKHKDVIKVLLGRGVIATINQTLDAETATEVAKAFGAEAEILSFEEDVLREETTEEKPEDLEPRAPVVTVMGHVDHGKTSLLDAIRQTKVVEKEAGGITQHVGAYSVDVNGRGVVFLDTPGHEAFTMMRARGAGVTDIVVLVVAADDGVMPQTREAIDHSRAAGVPMMVAINKIDKPNANPDRVKQQLADLDLVPEDWGGNTVYCEVSAKKRQGLDLMLEMVLLVADLLELKANPGRAGMGTVLEAKLDKGKGPVAHVLVQNGTINVGDSFVAGAVYGKVRAMFDDRGQKVKSVGPASPVEILGLTSLPHAGDQFQVFTDTAKARQISEFRQQKLRERELASSARLTLDQLHRKVQEGKIQELPIVLKADVQGSVEVLTDTLTKLSTDQVKVRIIHAGAGAISDTDVLLASASNAVVVGFNVRPERTAQELAEKENIDIRLHTIIYNVTDEIKKAIEGLLEPTFKEVTLGRAEVRETFKVPKAGVIAGCYVVDGKVTRNAQVRLLRDNVVVFEGKVGSLKRFKDDVSEVREGFECGIGLAGYNDVKIGDEIEAFVMEKVRASAS